MRTTARRGSPDVAGLREAAVGRMSSEVSTGSGATEDELSDASRSLETPEENGAAAVATELPLDQVFEILRNQRRRYVLRILEGADEPIMIGDLAERIAALENDKAVHEITSSERKRVYVGLYQAHLPKMDGMDVIEFNKPRGVIEPGPNADAFEEYITREEAGPDPPWHLYYGGLSLLGTTGMVVALLLGGAASFPLVELTLFLVVVAFLACSGANVWWHRRRADDGADGD